MLKAAGFVWKEFLKKNRVGTHVSVCLGAVLGWFVGKKEMMGKHSTLCCNVESWKVPLKKPRWWFCRIFHVFPLHYVNHQLVFQ